MNRKLSALVVSLAAALCAHAQAQPAKPPAATAQQNSGLPAPGTLYVVKGFRSAHFGDTADQVMAAIQKDFGVKPADLQKLTNIADDTTAFAVPVPTLLPGPGPATVTYVIGKGSSGLIHVNVVWLMTGNVPPARRGAMIAAGIKLANYFRAFAWTPKTVVSDIPVGPNNVVLFSGRDAGSNVVEVAIFGVPFHRDSGGKTVASPPATGPVRLRVAYGSANEKKEIAQIKAGQF